MLKTKENREPIKGIKLIMLTSINPSTTCKNIEGFFELNALARLYPKKQNRTTLPNTLITIPMTISERRIGIPINTSERTAEKMTSPVKITMLNAPVPKIGQKVFLICDEAKEIWRGKMAAKRIARRNQIEMAINFIAKKKGANEIPKAPKRPCLRAPQTSSEVSK